MFLILYLILRLCMRLQRKHAHQNVQTAEIVEESPVTSEEQSIEVVSEPMREESSQGHLSAEIQSEVIKEPLLGEQAETVQKMEQPIENSGVAGKTPDAVQNETIQAEQLSADIPSGQTEEIAQPELSQQLKAELQDSESLKESAETEAAPQNAEQKSYPKRNSKR